MCPEYVVIRVEFVCQLCTSNSSMCLCMVSHEALKTVIASILSRDQAAARLIDGSGSH